jgi:sugar phosphate isomerase/epimerase
MEFVQSHAPGGNPLRRDAQFEPLLQATVRAAEVCGRLGIPNTVVHSGCLPEIGWEEFLQRNLEFYRLLCPVMERTGVAVLIENSTRVNLGTQEFFYTGAQMREFLERADHPLFGACWDTGHANCEGHQYRDLTDLGPYLKAVHINDNRGTADEHLIPFCGTCCFDEVMRGLTDASFEGPFTLECSSTLRPGKYWLGDRRTFGEGGRLTEPGPELYDAAERLLYLAGKQLLDAYGLFEE